MRWGLLVVCGLFIIPKALLRRVGEWLALFCLEIHLKIAMRQMKVALKTCFTAHIFARPNFLYEANMQNEEPKKQKVAVRKRADAIKDFRCKNLIAVIEDPVDIRNIGTVIRNVNALGVEKAYVVDPRKALPDDWQDLRELKPLLTTSVSASKWTFVKRFDSADDCLDHLEKKGFVSVVTSPHVKGKTNVYLHEGDFTQHAKLAVWFGNEARGISETAVNRSEMCVAVPMFGMIESLNLGTCSGIVLYEIAKQRRQYQSQFRRAGQRGKRSVPLPTVMSRDEV